jgi:hypothetical protein
VLPNMTDDRYNPDMAKLTLWTVADAASHLGKTARDVQRYAKAKKLPHVTQVGTAYLFDPEVVKAFVPPPPGHPKGKPWTGKRRKKKKKPT